MNFSKLTKQLLFLIFIFYNSQTIPFCCGDDNVKTKNTSVIFDHERQLEKQRERFLIDENELERHEQRITLTEEELAIVEKKQKKTECKLEILMHHPIILQAIASASNAPKEKEELKKSPLFKEFSEQIKQKLMKEYDANIYREAYKEIQTTLDEIKSVSPAIFNSKEA